MHSLNNCLFCINNVVGIYDFINRINSVPYKSNFLLNDSVSIKD